MKILFLTDNFPPEVNAPAVRTYDHCREWLKQGASVTVLTCAPNFPRGKIYSGYSNRLFQREDYDGIEVVRIWTYMSPNEGFLRRTIDYLSFALSSFLAGLLMEADVIIATSPQFFTTFAACGLSRLKRIPWVFELRDLWPESIASVGAMRDGKLIRLLEKIELYLYRDADVVISLTQAFKNDLTKRHIPADKIKVVTNGSNLEIFRPRPREQELMDRLSLKGKFILGYLGTHGLAHNLEFIIDSLAYLKDRSIHCLFAGDGARKRAAMRLAEEKKLSNVTFLDTVPRDVMPRLLSILDVSLVPLRKSATFETVIPSKIFEAAAMRKPILLGVEGEAKRLVQDYHAGICFEPENRNDFINKLILLKQDRTMYSRLQEGCETLAKAHDRKNLAFTMLGYVTDVAASEKTSWKLAQ